MPRGKAPVDVKVLKQQLKDAKAATLVAKKNVADAQAKATLDLVHAKDYRTAVSDHITALKAMHVLVTKLSLAE